jgi:hypothetical protein
MKKCLTILAIGLGLLSLIYVVKAKQAAESEADLWSEALDPAF